MNLIQVYFLSINQKKGIIMDINHKNFELSFEIFPPRNLKASFKLWRTIEVLDKLNPNFISVTYGAGGSTRDLTQSAVSVIAKEYNIDVAGHLAQMHHLYLALHGQFSLRSKAHHCAQVCYPFEFRYRLFLAFFCTLIG